MKQAIILAALLVTVGISGCVNDEDGAINSGNNSEWRDLNLDGNVVVAVVDGGVNPYHFDMLAAHMPQHLNEDPSDDAPLDQDPATWLPGHPGAEAFASYTQLNLTLTPDNPDAAPSCVPSEGSTISNPVICDDERGGLAQIDVDQWDKVASSSADEINMVWIPGTKLVGLVDFAGNSGFATSSHGVGTSSVSVGNIHGSCPHCLLVFVNGAGEDANRWVEQQEWIDVQTNSWGYSAGVAVRDRFYAGSDVMSQKAAVERGQAIFFSAGNGLGNAFTAPNPTLFSSQEGPDWIITVGAISPADGSSYTGHGKPTDIASIGSGYPSAGGATVNSNSTFSGTSNSTPVTAGMYAEALWRIRNMEGTKIQASNVISQGGSCGPANAECPLADGELSYQELREAMYAAAVPTDAGHNPGGTTTIPQSNNAAELNLMAQGHGSFFAKLNDDETWESEVQTILDLVTGESAWPVINPELDAWRNAMSFCTQILWGEWELGHNGAESSALPASDPEWPVRTWFVDDCPTEGPAIMAANHAVTEAHPLY